ncbi:MAG: alternative oxidase [bacterium]
MSIALQRGSGELERLNTELNDEQVLADYRRSFDNYHASLLPRVLGNALVWCGNAVYGERPSYLKFRAVEVIARVPYQSWNSAAYTLLTLFYRDEKKALKLSELSQYARVAEDNETMHVVVISSLAAHEAKAGTIRHTIVPMLFAFFYFWASYLLFLIKPKYSFELNYLFESHAFEQYDRFLKLQGPELKKKPISSEFLNWYGRHPRSQYEFFLSVRNDEIIHRNTSIEEIEKTKKV